MEASSEPKGKSFIYLMVPFRKLCIATVAIPIATLIFCFVTAYIYQQDDIHETHCRVRNFFKLFL